MLIDFDKAGLAALFPCFILLGRDLSVLDAGPTLRRLLPDLRAGDGLPHHFTSASLAEAGLLALPRARGQAIRLESGCGRIRLSGTVLEAEGAVLLAMRIVPSEFLLDGDTLQISDFSPEDPMVHALLLASMQRAIIGETRAVAVELAEERNRVGELLDQVSRTAGFMAHDFNNLLAVIQLTCEAMVSGVAGTPDLLRQIGVIRDATLHGSALTQSLMFLSRQQADLKVAVMVDQLIAANRTFLATVAGTGIELETGLGAPGEAVEASPAALLGALVNLVINARDAMPDGGKIVLSTRHRHGEADADGVQGADHVDITIAGTGGSEADGGAHSSLARDPLSPRRPAGTGIGLAAVTAFAREARGAIWCDRPDHASSGGCAAGVRLALPIHVQTAPPATSGESCPVEAPTVMIVEDELHALEALVEMFEARDYRVIPCSTIAEADAVLVRGRRVDLLLSDIVMGQQSGAQFARRAAAARPDLKVILMSGYVPASEDIDAAWVFLRKPLQPGVLFDLVAQALARSEAPAG